MTTLKQGDKAPDFLAKDQNGNTIKLGDFKGKKVILYFYPKDNTPGCTNEACNFRDNYEMLQSKGFEVIGVSTDSEKSHQKFINKHNLPFTLLVDEEKELVNKYGVWGPKKFMGREYDGLHRTTFVIDEKGEILEVIKKVDTKNSSAQVLKLLGIEV